LKLEKLMYNISTVCPTRGRPYSCEKMIQSWIKNTNNSELILYFQNDDTPENLKKYRELSEQYNKSNIKWIEGPRLTSGMIWNQLYQDYSSAPIIHLGSDDLNYITPHWDEKVKQVANMFSDEIYCISVREGGKEDKGGIICRHPIVSRKMTEALGYFYPPFFIHYNVDIWWRDITSALKRFVIMNNDVLISHVREEVMKEHDWRKEFYYEKINNHKTNYVWARDKYVKEQIDRYLKLDCSVLKELMK